MAILCGIRKTKSSCFLRHMRNMAGIAGSSASRVLTSQYPMQAQVTFSGHPLLTIQANSVIWAGFQARFAGVAARAFVQIYQYSILSRHVKPLSCPLLLMVARPLYKLYKAAPSIRWCRWRDQCPPGDLPEHWHLIRRLREPVPAIQDTTIHDRQK